MESEFTTCHGIVLAILVVLHARSPARRQFFKGPVVIWNRRLRISFDHKAYRRDLESDATDRLRVQSLYVPSSFSILDGEATRV